ncbi:MAG: phosphoribosyltransferase family protein, partial [Flavobacteriales bacterium]|nr:phosphoribosyltransferase family protein [Flavobacteriales bacterium]
RLCVACGAALLREERDMCLSCHTLLPRFSLQKEERIALERLFYGRLPLGFVVAHYKFDKSGSVQKVIHAIKYHQCTHLAERVGRWLGLAMREAEQEWPADVVVPVPLHPKKLKSRGYNQSEYFGRGLAAEIQIPLEAHLVERVKHTRSQTGMNQRQRWENVKDAFRCTASVNGLRVLLVDDVLTTGSTVEACGRALVAAGADLISVAVMASAFGHR